MTKPRLLYGIWTGVIAALLALHFVHLRADFPNFSPWMDYAKYTDEGWYGNAAIRHALFGAWHLDGDFNPAAALPVWPLLEALLFSVTGVSLVAARSLALVIFAVNLVLSYALLRRFVPRAMAFAGVTFLAASAFLWAFSRLAILEPLLIALTLSAWLLALALPRAGKTRRLLLVGLLLCLAVLTKTTAIFLAPATLLLVWKSDGHKLWTGLRSLALVAAGGLVPWLIYFALLVRPHYLTDYRYLFAANQWVRPTTISGQLWAFWFAFHGAGWIDPTLCWLALGVMALALVFARARRVWTNPLVLASVLGSAGYIFFIGWHNSPQPRYYQVIAYPLVFITCIAVAELSRQSRALGTFAVAALAATTAANIYGEVRFARHPEYSFVDAAQRLTRYIDRHPNGKRLLLSISGDDITLITHLPAICDDFGTYDLPRRIHEYQPGWYAAWNELDPGTLEDLHTQYTLEQVATFHAFDDQDRDELILYKLHPLPLSRQKYDPDEEQGAGD